MTSAQPVRRWIVTGAVATGALLGVAGIAGAATSSSTTAANTATAAAAADPATAAHGPGETLLTGTTAAKVKAAALAAVPGATIVRVETDSGSATYEAHMQKSDGTYVTVLLDGNFKVTSTEQGFGGGGGHPASTAPTA